VESDSQVRSRDTGEPIQKRRGFAAAPKPSGPVVTEGMDDGMEDVDDPHPPSNRPFPPSFQYCFQKLSV